MLECVALHQLVVGPPARAEYIGVARPDRMETGATARVDSYVDNLVGRSEGQGRAQSGWWIANILGELEALIDCSVQDFEAASKAALDRLVICTPANAQSGLIMF